MGGIANSSKCLFCNENQALQHVVSSCVVSLNERRWNWRHDSILLNIARFMGKIPGVTVYCGIDNVVFQTPSIITGDEKRPDIVIVKGNLCMIFELTVGFETNLRRNSDRKFKKYKDLIIFIICKSEYGCYWSNWNRLQLKIHLYRNGTEKEESTYIIRQIINVCIRSTYFIFCQRNKQWESLSLLAW